MTRPRICHACRKSFPSLGTGRRFCLDCYSAAEAEALDGGERAYPDEDAYRDEVARILREREAETDAASCSTCGELHCDCPQGDPPESMAEQVGMRGFL